MSRLKFWPELADEIVVAQVEAFKRRVPILYGVLIANTVAMAVTHYGAASDFLAIYAPAMFCLIMALRSQYWLKIRNEVVTPAVARATIRKTTILAGVLALSMLAWACMLYSRTYNLSADFGGITQRGHAVLYVGLTVMCCITLLMHARLATTIVTAIVLGPFCGFLLISGSLVEHAVAVNFILIAAAMLYVSNVYSREFLELITSRTELEALSTHQTYLANTDPLTSLASRRHFFDCFNRVVESRTPFALLLIDLDGFKQINDLYGHAVGDDVLSEIGRRIARVVDNHHCVARIGGDEFAVVHRHTHPASLVALGEGIILECSQPLTARGISVQVGASVGVSIYTTVDADQKSSHLLEQADFALSFVKQCGKGRVQIFDPEHERVTRRRGEIEQALRSADLDTELHLVFQPIVASTSGAVVGVEALARWHSPTLGNVPPAEFIPAAERSGLVGNITLAVLGKALGQARRWPSRIQLKINISARDISSPLQMLKIVAAVRRSGLLPSRLTFELTETALGNDFDAIRDSVELIRFMGSSLAIDDFGTGYSSLNYVHRLKPDLIKIDRSFVTRICDPDGSESIVRTIVELCRNVKARSLAEGVETAEEADALRRLGVDEMQGYFFGKPVLPELVRLDLPVESRHHGVA